MDKWARGDHLHYGARESRGEQGGSGFWREEGAQLGLVFLAREVFIGYQINLLSRLRIGPLYQGKPSGGRGDPSEGMGLG